jgi:hypothetical protein
MLVGGLWISRKLSSAYEAAWPDDFKNFAFGQPSLGGTMLQALTQQINGHTERRSDVSSWTEHGVVVLHHAGALATVGRLKIRDYRVTGGLGSHGRGRPGGHGMFGGIGILGRLSSAGLPW